MKNECVELVLMHQGKIYELSKTPFIIGRDPDSSDFCIDNRTISRNHAKLTQTEGRWYLEDLQSNSGIILNGIAIDPSRKYEIVPNDCLELADVGLTVLSVNNQQMLKSEEGKLNSNEPGPHPDKSTNREDVEIKTEKQMKTIQGNRSLKNQHPGSGTASGKHIKKNDANRELSHFKTALKQFLSENDLDQKGMSRLNKIIELAHHLPNDELAIKNSVQEIMNGYSKKAIPVARMAEGQEDSKIQEQKILASQSQDHNHSHHKHADASGFMAKSMKNEMNQKSGTAKGPVFHPVKVEGDWIEIPVSKIPFTIGRGPENVDFVLHAAGISRSHCLVSFHDDFYHISDLGSTNGMSLNKKPLKANNNYKIKNGDSVSLGVNQFYVEVP